MQNKFGLKDFIFLVLLLGVGLSLWLGMVQDDRKWKELRTTQSQLNSIESSLARIQRQLDTGIAVARPAADPGVPSGGSAVRPAWAREGVPVVVATPWDFSVDPYEQEGFTPGGEFIEIFEGQPSKITPFLYADVYGRRVVDLITESLGWYDPQTLELRGRLAEAWQYDPNGMWLRVKIRDAARFSNGDPVLAEDVRWTFEELLYNAEIEAERFRSVYNAMVRLEVIGDPETSKVVEYHFKEPRFDNLAQAFGHKILPKSVYQAWIESPATFNQSTGLAVG